MKNLIFRQGRRSLILVLAISIFSAACSRDPNVLKKEYFESGMEYFEAQKLDEAAIEFRNALKVDPRFAEAGTMLARVLMHQRKTSEVYGLLLNAVDANPDYLPARITLGSLYLASARTLEARQEATNVLDREPNNLEALVLLANSQAADREFAEAEETLNHVLEIDPKFKDALLSLAAIRLANQQLAEAEALVQQVITNAPDSPEGYLRMAGFLAATGRTGEAEPFYVKAVEVSKDNIAILNLQYSYYIEQQRWAEAETVARKIQSLGGEEEKYWTAVADFHILRGEWDKAQGELERLLNEHDNALVIRRKLVEVYLSLNNGAKAQEVNDGILRESPRDALAHLANGRMLFAKGDYNNALLELNRTRQYQPDLPELHFWYGIIYSQRGDLEQAKQSLGEALQYNEDYWPARLVLAELQNRTGAPDAALINVQEVLKRNPGNLQAHLLMSQAYIVKHDFARAEELLQAILEQVPTDPQGRWQLGVLQMQKGNFAAAREQLEHVWNTDFQAEPALMATVMSYMMQDQPNQALGFLEQQISSRPELTSTLYRMRGDVNRLQNKPEEAIQDYNRALASNPGSSATAVALAHLYADGGKIEQGINLLQKTQQQNPQDPALPLTAGWLYERNQRWQEAQGSYERALALNGTDPVVLNNLAWVLAEHGGNIDVALKYAQQAKELQPNNVNITNTIGWIYYKKNSYQVAHQYLEQAATEVPSNASYQYQLGLVSTKLGKNGEARQALERALQLDPKSPYADEAKRALSELK